MAECRRWADDNGVHVPEGAVFFDKAVSGKKSRRVGFSRLEQAIDSGAYDVLITLTSSRLFRKAHQAMRFVDGVVEKGMRCVFVGTNFDTGKIENWKLFQAMYAIFDEQQLSAQVGNIQAAHKGKLTREQVHNTLPWGYQGVPDGQGHTRRMRPSARIEIDPNLRPSVVQIFEWFARDQLNLVEIARRLQQSGVPSPRRTKRWSRTAVRYMLRNRRYLGDWAYGRNKTIWRSEADYAAKAPRDKPLLEQQIDRLRIIDDDLFQEAQDRLEDFSTKYPGARRWKNERGQVLPDIVQDMLHCPRHQRLSISGANGAAYSCRACRGEADGMGLFSHLNRKLALELIIKDVATLLQADSDLVREVQDAARVAIERSSRPDPAALEAAKHRRERLTKDIDFVMRNIGDTESEQDESERRLAELRAQRRDIEKHISETESAMQAKLDMPSEEEIRSSVQKLRNVLQHAANSSDPDELLDLRRLVTAVTGGSILLQQQGERRQHGGWLRGTYTPNYSVLFPDVPKLSLSATASRTIDFRRALDEDALTAAVKAAFDANPAWTIRQIAESIQIHPNQAARKLRQWYVSRGLDLPNLRSRGRTLANCGQARNYRNIADEARALEQQGLLLQEIALKLSVNRCTVTNALNHWYRSNGVERSDGRQRRRSLPRQAPPIATGNASLPPNSSAA